MEQLFALIIPSLISGVMLWCFKRYVDKKDSEEKKRDAMRAKYNLFVLKGITASLSLGEATADFIEKEVKSQELSSAKTYATEIKREIKDFIFKQGTESII